MSKLLSVAEAGATFLAVIAGGKTRRRNFQAMKAEAAGFDQWKVRLLDGQGPRLNEHRAQAAERMGWVKSFRKARQRRGVRVASLGATPLGSAGRCALAAGHPSRARQRCRRCRVPLASLPPHSTTLARDAVPLDRGSFNRRLRGGVVRLRWRGVLRWGAG